MMIPGGNILATALRLIGRQQFTYLQFAGRQLNAVGIDVAQYQAPAILTGSAQPVPRDRYERYGLDFQRDYMIFYVEQDVLDIRRDVSGDQFVMNCKTYQCISITDWFNIDGWVGVLTVAVQPC